MLWAYNDNKNDAKIMRKIIIMTSITMLGFVFLFYACTDDGTLIAQHGNMVVLKIQMLAYKEEYGNMPNMIEELKLSHIVK